LCSARRRCGAQQPSHWHKSLNVTTNPISGNCFSEQAVGTHVVGYTAQAGVGFVLSLTNNTVAAVFTGGGCFGLAIN
jgi:hypothetical protein